MFLIINIGICRFFGVLWSILCRMSKGMTPLRSRNVSKFNLYKLLMFGTSSVFIPTTETDIGSKCNLPFNF